MELVIRAFEDGAKPEAIVQRYPSTTLADIYAVIAYYLRHPALVERCLAEREHQAEALRENIETRQGDLSVRSTACLPSEIRNASPKLRADLTPLDFPKSFTRAEDAYANTGINASLFYATLTPTQWIDSR